jgi:hypothetical protein
VRVVYGVDSAAREGFSGSARAEDRIVAAQTGCNTPEQFGRDARGGLAAHLAASLRSKPWQALPIG